MNFSTPIEEIPRVGPAYQKKLKKLGIKTVHDLLYHFPHRYEDFSNLIPIAKAEHGGPFCFQGEILDIRNIRTFRRRMMLTQMTIGDETGKLKALWFNQPYLINAFKKGEHVCLAGKISGKGSAKYLSSPAYEKIPAFAKATAGEPENFNNDLTHTGRLIPVYPETEGLSSKWLRFIVKPILIKLRGQILEPLPEKIINEYGFLPFQEAIWQIHFPESLKTAQIAKKRFAFEELFILSLFVQRERMKLAREKAIPVPLNLELVKEFTGKLPFELTDAQRKSAWQILKDMEKPRPMNRLLEGDVGSGKTVVAAIAALNAAKANYQTAIMAPTEILSKQHYKTISNLLERFSLKIGLITGKESYLEGEKTSRKELLEKVKNGQVDILIGTHAIIQDTNPRTKYKTPVQFNSLAFVIIDEQHRFGVEQRANLCQQKKFVPHLLSMTATPIPRTLALTVYGDLDLSLIDESPKGRKKIITEIVQPKDKKETYDFIRGQVKEGRQVFVICPRIEPSARTEFGKGQGFLLVDERNFSWMEVKAVKEEYQKLSKEIFPDLKVAMLHGKMKVEEKEKAMKDFKNKKVDILVSTSVIEVGIDVPNATVMLIEGSEKFGLAQLHQFRGRVGRSDFQSYCFLFTESRSSGAKVEKRTKSSLTTESRLRDESKNIRSFPPRAIAWVAKEENLFSSPTNAPGIITNRRLRALISCENGFELAEKDLAIRGPGDFLGSRQWGIPDLTMASLADAFSVEKARSEAKEILQEDHELKKYPLLKKRLEEFKKRIHLE